MGRLLYLGLLAACLLLNHVQVVNAVWPHPRVLTTGAGTRTLDASNLKLTSDNELPSDVHDAFERMRQGIVDGSYDGLNNPKQGNGSSAGSITEIKVSYRSGPSKRSEQVFLPNDRARALVARNGNDSISIEARSAIEKLDEKYILDVPATGPVHLQSNSSLGLLRGFTTLELLTYSAGSGPERYVTKTPIHVEDQPAYPYRGFLLDTARNYLSVRSIKRQLDAASLVKMNQFHWHIVDSQSFPLVLPGKLAKLSKAGAYSPSQVYRPEDIKEITDYAAARGINVNVEIDMPGHNYAGVKDYDPKLIVCGNKEDWQNWSNEPPSGQLDLKSSAVRTYVRDVITETAKLFPGPYFSTGNDEVNLHCYGAKNKSDIDASLLKPFVVDAHKAVTDAGKTPMVWEEAAIDFPETGKALLPDTLVQVWISAASVAKVLAANDKIRVINSPLDTVYLDLGRGEWLTGSTGQSYSPYCTVGQIYKFDVLNGTTSANAHRVVGSEALLWSEQSDDATVDSLLWPRAAALAEVIWTGSKKSLNGNSTNLDLVEATPRLNELRYRLLAKGVGATPLQPQWCLKYSCPNPF